MVMWQQGWHRSWVRCHPAVLQMTKLGKDVLACWACTVLRFAEFLAMQQYLVQNH